MRSIRLTALGAAFALSTGLLVPSTGTARAVPSAAPPVATRVVHVDVDGDGAPDEVVVEQNGPDTFVVNVVTATGEDDVVQFTSTIDDDAGLEPWYGAARMDRVVGHELLLLSWAGDGFGFRVLTWRAGTGLVWQKAPKSRIAGAYDWYLADLGFARFGYRFTTSNGRRYVRDFQLHASGSRWRGTIVTSVWKAGGWQKIRSRSVNLSATQAQAYDGIGVTVVAAP